MYNMEQYIDQCLSSLIIGEGMEDLEVLVINDGSRDSSLSLARKYEQQYPQTYRVIDKENGNYGSCINRGLAECTGRYVRVLDADDYLETSNLAEFVRFLSIARGSLYEVSTQLEIARRIGYLPSRSGLYPQVVSIGKMLNSLRRRLLGSS
jgi:glycosyltransferase involved in cell wall biosynthesis